jgi:hypothetical protein
MDSLEELHRANICRHFRDCLGSTRPNWPTARRLETAPFVPYLGEKGHSIDPRYRVPASHRLPQLRLLSADVLQAFFEQSNFVFHKLYLIQ